MPIKGYRPYEDLEYARADEDAREKLPNRKFKLNQADGYAGDFSQPKKQGRGKKRKKREKPANANKRSKNYKDWR